MYVQRNERVKGVEVVKRLKEEDDRGIVEVIRPYQPFSHIGF